MGVTDPPPERVRVVVAVAVPKADRVGEIVPVEEGARVRVAVVVGLRDAPARVLVAVTVGVGDKPARVRVPVAVGDAPSRERVAVSLGLGVETTARLDGVLVGVTRPWDLDGEGIGDWPVVVIANRVIKRLNNLICYSQGNYH